MQQVVPFRECVNASTCSRMCIYTYACVHVFACMCVCRCVGIRKNTNRRYKSPSLSLRKSSKEQTQCFPIYNLIQWSEDLLRYCLVIRATKQNTKMTYPILLANSGAPMCPSPYALHVLVWFIIAQDGQAVEYDSGLPHTVLIRMGS